MKLSENIYLRRLFGLPYYNEGKLPELEGELAVEKEQLEKALDENPLFRYMSDVELVLRFFEYRNINSYTNLFHTFLDRYLNHANQFDDKLLQKLSKLFEETIKFAFDLLGENAFKLYRKK